MRKKLRIIAGLLGALILLVGLYPVIKIRQEVSTTKDNYKKLQKSWPSSMNRRVMSRSCLRSRSSDQAGRFPERAQKT